MPGRKIFTKYRQLTIIFLTMGIYIKGVSKLFHYFIKEVQHVQFNPLGARS